MHNFVSPENTQILFRGEVNNAHYSIAILLRLCANRKGLTEKNCEWRLLQCLLFQPSTANSVVTYN